MRKKSSLEADPIEKLRKELWENAKAKEWDKVIKVYRDKPEARSLEVTRSGETALRMAIADKQEGAVKEMVELMQIQELKKKNKLGNTALHLAAYMGNVRMCHSITAQGAVLLGESNNCDETPMIVAAKHGRKEAFLCMLNKCNTDTPEQRTLLNHKYCSGEGGRTVLHEAISAEHFDLAYQIINFKHLKLVNRFDKWGFLPLHLLAMKPTVFKSGCSMGLLHRLVYFCIQVKKLKIVPHDLPCPGNKETANEPTTLPISGSANALDARGVREKDEENPPNPATHEPTSLLLPESATGLALITSKALDAILWLGSIEIGSVTEEKKKHTWSVQIMNALLKESKYDGDIYGGDAYPSLDPNDKIIAIAVGRGNTLNESPLLTAAKYGILEMVEKILEQHPEAIHDVNLDEKNIVLVAVENRQPHIYQFILDTKILTDTIFYKTDKNGNSAMHLAATLSGKGSWDIPGAALHMQWAVKWYQFVEKSMPPRFFVLHNKDYKAPWSIFRDNHKELLVNAGKWLTKTSNSCSVVSILIATVAFAAYATVPGGLNSNTGRPVLERDAVFNLFAISSLIALCCSVSSVIMFLVFFTSKYREKDFARSLPTKILVEVSSLMVAVAALLVSFCAAHSFVINDSLKYTAFPLYVATLLPVAFYAFWQVPLYFEIAYATFHPTPRRIYAQ